MLSVENTSLMCSPCPVSLWARISPHQSLETSNIQVIPILLFFLFLPLSFPFKKNLSLFSSFPFLPLWDWNSMYISPVCELVFFYTHTHNFINNTNQNFCFLPSSHSPPQYVNLWSFCLPECWEFTCLIRWVWRLNSGFHTRANTLPLSFISIPDNALFSKVYCPHMLSPCEQWRRATMTLKLVSTPKPKGLVLVALKDRREGKPWHCGADVW